MSAKENLTLRMEPELQAQAAAGGLHPRKTPTGNPATAQQRPFPWRSQPSASA